MDTSASRLANVPLAPHGSALVFIEDDRAALQAVLLLQEFGIAVDIVGDEAAALSWARRANYQFVICGGDDRHDLLAVRLLRAAPRAQIVHLSRGDARQNLRTIGIETLALPLDVNAFVEVARGSH